MWVNVVVLIVVGALVIVGFICIRKERFSGGGSVGNALQEVSAVFDPGVRNTIEETRQEHVREDDSGAPPLDKEHDSEVT